MPEQVPALLRLKAELKRLTSEQKAALKYAWSFHARPEQMAPEGDWQFWMFCAGRGSGKTRAGAEFVRDCIKKGYRRIALVAPTNDDFHKVMVTGESGILSCCPPWDYPVYNENKKTLTWPNGGQAFGYSAEKPNRLRGPQFDAAWTDEIAAWHGSKNHKPGETSRRQNTWDMLMYGLRLGNNPRCFISTTPLPVDVIKTLIESGLDPDKPAYTITRGSTYSNRANLSEQFLSSIVSKYEGTRLGRQELLGELLMDVPGALWTLDMIASARNTTESPEEVVNRMQRVVVAVDPSGAASMSDETSDEIGIVVAGKGADDYSVIADRSMKGSPVQWARTAVKAYHEFKADRIVAERNFGGEMVRSVIQNADANIRVDLVTASRGKAIRAEPIALLYERGEVHHVGILGHLEDQLIRMTPGGYIGDGSPDRLDAAVWALTELSEGATVQHYGVA